MKRMNRGALVAFVAVLWVAVAGCKDDDPKENVRTPYADLNGEIDMAAVSEVKSRTGGTAFKCKSVEEYRMDALTDSRWEWWDTSGMDGWGTAAPSKLVFCYGKCIVPFELFKSSGPHPLWSAWNAYQIVTRRNIHLMLESPFDVTPDSRAIKIGKHDFVVESLVSGRLTLSYTGHYEGGRTQAGGEYLEVSKYEEVSVDSALDNALCFDSEEDLCRGVIALLREQFGEEIDLNAIYSPDIIFDNPIISISYLEWFLFGPEG